MSWHRKTRVLKMRLQNHEAVSRREEKPEESGGASLVRETRFFVFRTRTSRETFRRFRRTPGTGIGPCRDRSRLGTIAASIPARASDSPFRIAPNCRQGIPEPFFDDITSSLTYGIRRTFEHPGKSRLHLNPSDLSSSVIRFSDLRTGTIPGVGHGLSFRSRQARQESSESLSNRAGRHA